MAFGIALLKFPGALCKTNLELKFLTLEWNFKKSQRGCPREIVPSGARVLVRPKQMKWDLPKIGKRDGN